MFFYCYKDEKVLKKKRQRNKPIFFCKGSEKNFKVTTPDEVDLFKGMMLIENEK